MPQTRKIFWEKKSNETKKETGKLINTIRIKVGRILEFGNMMRKAICQKVLR